MNEKEALLQQLHDVEVETVSQIPAIGWWLVVLVLLLAVWLCWWQVKRRKRLRWSVEARDELASIRQTLQQNSNSHTLARCSALARRVSLVAQDRKTVAAQQGELWLNNLDALCGKPHFSQGLGRMLMDMPYQKTPQVPEEDLHSLCDALDDLINSVAASRNNRGVMDAA